jgi:ERCC4-type nuclease
MTEHDVKLVLDNRENALHKLILQLYPAEEIDFLEVKTLDVGDICLVVDSKPVLLIERKAASDLLSSFDDGRFLEQREKMLIARRESPQLLLMLLVEGDYEELVLRFNSMPERRDNPKRQFNINRIHSAFKSLFPNYGIVRHNTDSIAHTAVYLGDLMDLYKVSGGLPHLENNANLYNVTKLPKKLSLSARETYALSLATVRGVSKEMALVIARHFPSYRYLLDRYRKLKTPVARETMLANLTYGKGRRIGPATSTRVYHMIWDNTVDAD